MKQRLLFGNNGTQKSVGFANTTLHLKHKYSIVLCFKNHELIIIIMPEINSYEVHLIDLRGNQWKRDEI